jgi:hypothetical protein
MSMLKVNANADEPVVNSTPLSLLELCMLLKGELFVNLWPTEKNDFQLKCFSFI